MSFKTIVCATAVAAALATTVMVPEALAARKMSKAQHAMMAKIHTCMNEIIPMNHMSNDELVHQFMGCMSK